MRRFAAGLLAFSLASTAMAFGELDQLEGSAILVAGDIRSISCPISGTYDCLTWPNDLYEFPLRNICFRAQISCGLTCEGLIAEKNKVRTLFIVGGFSGLDSSSIQIYQCPSKF